MSHWHEPDEKECKELRARLQQAEADNAALMNNYCEAIDAIEKTILAGSIDYMNLQKQIDAFAAFRLSTNTGSTLLKELEGLRRVVDILKRRKAALQRSYEAVGYMENNYVPKAVEELNIELAQALAEAEKEGD